MFAFVVKRLGFLKSIPLLAIFFDSLIKFCMLIIKPKMLDWIDELEETILEWPETSTSLHKYGGTQFNHGEKEFAHLHSNGLLDILFNQEIKQGLKAEGRISDHHLFENSGWISFYIKAEEDFYYAKTLLRLSYQRKLI
jgi:hypothetical protein